MACKKSGKSSRSRTMRTAPRTNKRVKAKIQKETSQARWEALAFENDQFDAWFEAECAESDAKLEECRAALRAETKALVKYLGLIQERLHKGNNPI